MSGLRPADGRRPAAGRLPAAASHRPGGHLAPGVRLLLFRARGHRPRRHIALTFDDGLDPASTPRFLDALGSSARGAGPPFVLGEHVVRHPELVRETVRRWHELGAYGLDPRPPWRPGVRLRRRRSRPDRPHGTTLTGHRPRWYRLPYGIPHHQPLAAARRAGLRTVLSSAWAGTGRPTPRRRPYAPGSPRPARRRHRPAPRPDRHPPPTAGTRPWPPCRPSSRTAARRA
ncbi:polysaccharide deacetylase family protein [Streptomyces tricolor]|nr:polysaccharide deacetylase family protein [Streptomyces tricolor]